MEKIPSYEQFAAQLNKKFELQVEGQEPIEIELVQVSERLVTSNQERFSIAFRQPGSGVLPQQIYSVVNDSMGKTDLFLVPVKKDSEAVFYEAIFNRFVE